jgi:hypothetical protein
MMENSNSENEDEDLDSIPIVSRGGSNESDISDIYVDISECNIQKKSQIKNISKMIKKARAYSYFHYNKARKWWRIYWFGGIVTILLTSSLAMTNAAFDYDKCDITYNKNIKTLNVLSSSIITAILGIFTFLNPTERRRDREEAGDRYSQLANDIVKDTFLQNRPVSNLNTEKIIDIYSMRFNDYIENYFEPPRETMNKLLKQELIGDIDIVLKF